MRGLFLIGLLVASVCGAQVSGRFTIDRPSFAPGEPVFLNFTLHNDGKAAVFVDTADPYSFCSGYTLHVERSGSGDAACPLRSWGGSCPSSMVELAPGASRTEQILLNYQNRSRGDRDTVVRLPGDYTIEASRVVSFNSDPSPFSPQTVSMQQTLLLRVDPNLKAPAQTFAPAIAQLNSDDFETRRHAARTLATLAPADLESLLLSFATAKDPAIHESAPDALANLRTDTSLKALAALAQNEPIGTYTSMRSTELLGETHDPRWFPLLLSVADKSKDLRAAAKSGGDAAVPVLIARLRVADAAARLPILYALSETASADAVPSLIASIPYGPDANSEEMRSLAIQVNQMLQQLTHFTASTIGNDDDMSTWRPRWQRWWLSQGRHPKTFFAEDCGRVEMLP